MRGFSTCGVMGLYGVQIYVEVVKSFYLMKKIDILWLKIEGYSRGYFFWEGKELGRVEECQDF